MHVCLRSTSEGRDEYHDIRDVFLIVVDPRHDRYLGAVSLTCGFHLGVTMTIGINLGL